MRSICSSCTALLRCSTSCCNSRILDPSVLNTSPPSPSSWLGAKSRSTSGTDGTRSGSSLSVPCSSPAAYRLLRFIMCSLSSQFSPYGLHAVSYTHLRAHETRHDLVCRLLLEKKKKKIKNKIIISIRD